MSDHQHPMTGGKTVQDALASPPLADTQFVAEDASAHPSEARGGGVCGGGVCGGGVCGGGVGGGVGGGLNHSKSNLSIGLSVIPGGAPGITLSRFQAASVHILDNFFKSDDTAQAVEELRQLDASLYHDVFVVHATQSVLARDDDTQAKLAQLFTLLYDSKLLTRRQATRGFEKLIQLAGVIHDEVDNVEDKLFAFFAAATDDGVVDPTFIQRLPEALLRSLTRDITDNEPNLKTNVCKLKLYKQKCESFMEEFFNDGTATALENFFIEVEPIVKGSSCAAPGSSENTVAAARLVKVDVFRHELVRRLLSSALGKSPAQREMVSKSLSDAYGSDRIYSLAPDDVQLGVIRLLAGMQDVALDNPRASDMISKFIVRMVVDEILPPAFVSDFIRLNLGDALSQETLRRAFKWMTSTEPSRHHLLVERFSKVWTAAEGYRPEVEQFKRALRDIIFDYFDTPDISTAVQYFNQLELSPDQEIEAVRKIIVFAMERQQEEWTLALTLLENLKAAGELDTESIIKGFTDIQEKMADIQLDNPNAEKALKDFFGPEAIARQLVPNDFSL